MEQKIYDEYVEILKEELLPAMGCTEPIAVAYAAAVAVQALGEKPESVEVNVSANIIKNVKSVVVPCTGGLRGIGAAVCAGIVAGCPEKELEILEEITEVACVAEPLYHYRINSTNNGIMHRKVNLKNLEEVDVNYGMLRCALKYGKKDAAYLQYEIMKSYFKRVQKNLPPEEQNDEKVQHTVDEIHRAKKELMEAGADTLRNKLEAAVWFANARVYYRLKGWT